MLEPGASRRLNCKILYGELLTLRPQHHRLCHFDPLLIWQRVGKRERLPWSHGQIPRGSPAGTGEIPHGAHTLE